MGIKGLKVQIAVLVQLQRALHDPSRGIRVLSSQTMSFSKKLKYIYILFNHSCSSCTSPVMHSVGQVTSKM